MKTELTWCVAILSVAALNAFNYFRLAYKVKVFRYFGRVALTSSGLVYLSLMAVIPVVCVLALLSIPCDAYLFGSEVSEVAVLTGSTWASNHAMSWLSLGVVVTE